MRILHLLSQTELTGAEVYAQNLIESQTQENHSVHVISDRMHVPVPVPVQNMNLSTSKFFQRWKNIFALRKFLQEKKIEVIHCHSRGAVRHAHWARLNLPVALVTTLHGRQHFSWSKRLFHIYGELLVAVCENVKRAMAIDFGMPESGIWVLRNPIRPDVVTATRTSPLPETFRLGLLGRSSGPKGQRIEEMALNCFEKWLQLAPSLKIEIVAPKPERFSSRFQIHLKTLNRKFPGRIEVLGHLENLREKIKDYDLTICSGRIAVESLLAKVPVLAVGEYCSHGLVTLENLKANLESNFGDIGARGSELKLNLPEIEIEVEKLLAGALPADSERNSLKQQLEIEFDPSSIQKEILRIYSWAIFKRHVPNWIPVLMYHKIPDQELQSQHRIFVIKEKFEKHLQFFRKQQFQTLTFSDLHAFVAGKRPYSEFPQKPLMLTFDDGYVDNLTTAQPLLKQYGFRATLFLLGNHSIVENTWDSKAGELAASLMTLEQKKSLDPSIWEIGSHGFDHLHLPEVPKEDAFRELKESKVQLEADFKRPIFCFAYPFGSTTPQIAEMARKAGYEFGVNTDQGGLHLADDPHSIFRVNIFPEDGVLQLWKKTSSWYRASFYRKRGR